MFCFVRLHHWTFLTPSLTPCRTDETLFVTLDIAWFQSKPVERFSRNSMNWFGQLSLPPKSWWPRWLECIKLRDMPCSFRMLSIHKHSLLRFTPYSEILYFASWKRNMQWFCAATQVAVAWNAHATLQLDKLFFFRRINLSPSSLGSELVASFSLQNRLLAKF